MEQKQVTSVRDIAERYNLSFVVRFGSTARGTAGPQSDIDLLLGVDATLGLREESELRCVFAEVLAVPEDSIDLSYAEQSSGLLTTRALEEGEVLYSAGSALRLAQLRAWRKMQTEQKFYDQREQYVHKTFAVT